MEQEKIIQEQIKRNKEEDVIVKRQQKLKVLYDKNIGLSKKLESTAYQN